MRITSEIGKRSAIALAFAGALAGCATSIVSHGDLRPGALEAIVERTERARGIEAAEPVDARVVTKHEMRAIIEEVVKETVSKQDMQSAEDALVVLGLWPRGRNLFEESVSTMGEEAGGVYLPQHKILYIVSDLDLPVGLRIAQAATGRDFARELLLSHELIHALQHQAYPELVELTTTLTDQDDIAVALHSALEGDAQRYSFEALETGRAPPAPVDMRRALVEDAESGSMKDAPDIIRYGLIFPYAYGYELSMLEATLLVDRPPVSTEQVLHRDRRHQPFTQLDLGALHSLLPSGCELLTENTLGEMAIAILFGRLAPAVEPEAWRGWDGDRYLAARCGSGLEMVWVTSWDSARDAEEFLGAYMGMASEVARSGGLAWSPASRRKGSAANEVIVYTRGFSALAASVSVRVRRTRLATFEDVQEYLEQ